MDEELPRVGEQNDSVRSKVIRDLQKEIDAGLNSGPEVTFDPEAFKRNMRETRN